METLEGIGTAIAGLLTIVIVIGWFYYILGALTNADIKHGSGKKLIITSKDKRRSPQDVYLDKYAEEFVNDIKKTSSENQSWTQRKRNRNVR